MLEKLIVLESATSTPPPSSKKDEEDVALTEWRNLPCSARDWLTLPCIPDPPENMPAGSSLTAHQDIGFYYKSSWKVKEGDRERGQKGQSKRSRGELGPLGFLVDQLGTPVDGEMASRVSDFARSIWAIWIVMKVAPETFSKKNAVLGAHYINTMCAQFPFLRHSDGHWKCEEIGTLYYPSWYKNCVRQELPLPTTIPGANEGVAGAGGRKRGRSDTTNTGAYEPPSKQYRVSSVSSYHGLLYSIYIQMDSESVSSSQPTASISVDPTIRPLSEAGSHVPEAPRDHLLTEPSVPMVIYEPSTTPLPTTATPLMDIPPPALPAMEPLPQPAGAATNRAPGQAPDKAPGPEASDCEPGPGSSAPPLGTNDDTLGTGTGDASSLPPNPLREVTGMHLALFTMPVEPLTYALEASFNFSAVIESSARTANVSLIAPPETTVSAKPTRARKKQYPVWDPKKCKTNTRCAPYDIITMYLTKRHAGRSMAWRYWRHGRRCFRAGSSVITIASARTSSP
jgi:hypothetical protein